MTRPRTPRSTPSTSASSRAPRQRPAGEPTARRRLQKILAEAGIASRRAAEDLLRSGRVSVNGRVAKLGDSAEPERDEVAVDGVPVAREPSVYWLLHKPRGVITTVRDPEGRSTVRDLVPDREHRLFPVGRLDRDTEGLLLLTNDGRVAHALLHPSHESEREYRVTVRGRISAASLARLAAGIELEEGRTAPARVGRAEFDAVAGSARFTLTLIEGRKRQIRRSLAALGHPVLRLLRVRMGPLELGDLAPGQARRLRPAERRALLASTGVESAARLRRPGREPR
jgi:23S rRNA pseudouridine2605 synthase